MKVTLVGYGTRGDVQPYVCVGWELTRRGHEVTICAPVDQQTFVERAGLRYAPIPVDVHQILSAEAAQRMLARGDFAGFMSWFGEVQRPYEDSVFEAYLAAAQGADLIVSHPLSDNELCMVGAHQRIPVLPLYLYPVVRSRHMASLFLTTRNLWLLNGLSHSLVDHVLWKASRDRVQRLRQKIGLPRAKGLFSVQVEARSMPALLSYSESLCARPSDWPANIICCPGITPSVELRQALGEHGLDPALEQWLADGPPVIYLGFGSMPVLDPRRTLDMVRRVVQGLGVRAVVGAGWSQLCESSEQDVRVIGPVDQTALFPRCAAVVHHGGAGTTYASVRAGVPTLVCSVFNDQPYWGTRLQALGVGETFPFQKLDERRLESALRRLFVPEVRERAQALGERVRLERGSEEVAGTIERIAASIPLPE
jgi:sterol 3beta-glucosyltransferase